MLNVRSILHPTDFSERSEPAFRLACALARDYGASVVVLHVVPPPATRAEEVARLPPDDYHEQLWREFLLRMTSPEPGVRLGCRLEDGDPGKEIVRVAEELGCDLIVLSTHGRTGLRRLLMGSVAEQVLRTAPCPVLTVKGPFPGEASRVDAGEEAGVGRP
jgi:nucleotide-binding universal stress UspA family protein